MKPENILFGEKFEKIWKEVRIKLPREDYCENLADNKERTKWAISEINDCVNVTADIFKKPEQEIIKELYEFLVSDEISLSDFTSRWIDQISEEEFDDDELSDFLNDTGMSEEEYLEYSAVGSYDISIVFEVLIYTFIMIVCQINCTSSLKNTSKADFQPKHFLGLLLMRYRLSLSSFSLTSDKSVFLG